MKDSLKYITHRLFPSRDRESEQLFRNSSWVFLANSLGFLFAFVKTILTTRILGAELLGIYALSIATVLTVQEFLRLNISMGLIRFGAGFKAEERTDKVVSLIKYSLLLSALSVTASILVIVVLLIFFYNSFFKLEGLQLYILLFALANGFSFIDAIGKSSLKLFFKFKSNSMIQIIMDTIEVSVVVITLYVFGADLKAFFTATISAKMLNSIVCNIAAYRELKPEINGHEKSPISLVAKHKKEFNRYIFGNSISSSLKVFMNQGDVILLGFMSSTQQIGFYSAAKKLAYSVLMLTDPLTTSIFPQFSKLVAEKAYLKARTMISNLTLYLFPVLLVAVAAGLFFKDNIIVLAYGKEYQPASLTFFILLISALQGVVFFWSLPLIQSLGLIKKRIGITIIAIAFGALAAVLTIPAMESGGAALGLLLANLIITGKFVQLSFKRLSKQECQ